MPLIRLTYIHWSTRERGSMLLNTEQTLAIVPHERDGISCSQVTIQGYNYTVAETIDEIEALIRGYKTVNATLALDGPR